MKVRCALLGTCSAIAILATSAVHAEDGYDAPADWPSPVEEHLMWGVLVDRFEYVVPDKGDEALVWDFTAWYGGDINRVYLKGEGENIQGDGESAEFESLDLLYSRLIADFWELQGGGGLPRGHRHQRPSATLLRCDQLAGAGSFHVRGGCLVESE